MRERWRLDALSEREKNSYLRGSADMVGTPKTFKTMVRLKKNK